MEKTVQIDVTVPEGTEPDIVTNRTNRKTPVQASILKIVNNYSHLGMRTKKMLHNKPAAVP